MSTNTENKFIKTLTAAMIDKDGKVEEVGPLSVKLNTIIAIMPCVDKHECLVTKACVLAVSGGPHMHVKGSVKEVTKLIEDCYEANNYGQ